MQALSDKLFMFFLVLLVLSFLINGFGFASLMGRPKPSDDTEDREDREGKEEGSRMTERNRLKYDRQDKQLMNIIKSKLFWISLLGLAVSVLLSYL